ncbi:MAG TPA: S41 family peptidase [Opitutus sp.]|nr:S41 family peptidase [Opitutus sp.]
MLPRLRPALRRYFRTPATFALLAVQLAVATPARALGPETVAFRTFSLADLTADFDQLRSIIENQHPKLYTDRTALEVSFIAERARLYAGMNEIEFLRVLRGLVRQVNCGHTSIQLAATTESAAYVQRRLLPLAVKTVDGRCFVTGTPAASPVPRGAEIRAINGLSADTILAQLLAGIPSDGTNLTLKFHVIDTQFAELFWLLVDTSSQFQVDYLDPLTRLPATATLGGIASASRAQLEPAAPPDNGGLGASSFGDDYATLFVKSFNFYDATGHTRFFRFVDDFFSTVAQRHIANVILDLRGNGGGDPYCGAYLFQRLISRGWPYFNATTPYYPSLQLDQAPAANAFTGSLFVLIDGGCFSTTGHFTSLLKYHGIGRFIGTETGGSFACTANTRLATLLHTALRFTYATDTFAAAVSGLTPGRGIVPDVALAPSAPDYLAGRDVVGDFAVSLLHAVPPSAVIAHAPDSATAAGGASVAFTVQPTDATAAIAWQRNGVSLAGASARLLSLSSVQLGDTGLYSATVASAAGTIDSVPAILGFVSDEKAVGASEVGRNITHPNGNIYDQTLLTADAACITADSGQVTRLSFVDLQDDIVQVEFTGAGTLAVAFDAWSPPTPPRNYNQPGVNYAKGHARLVIAGANETTNVAIFSVGRANAVDQSLFRDDVNYDGWADIASLAISSTNGRFGGIYAGNARFSAVRGPTGLYAPDVAFSGPVTLADLHAGDEAQPYLVIGSAPATRIAGGDLEQLNGRAVEVAGLSRLQFVAGSDSHGRPRAAQANRAVLREAGVDVTALIVDDPGS